MAFGLSDVESVRFFVTPRVSVGCKYAAVMDLLRSSPAGHAVSGQRSGEGGFGLVFHSVVFIHCGFYRRLLPVFLQAQRQTQSHGRHLKRTKETPSCRIQKLHLISKQVNQTALLQGHRTSLSSQGFCSDLVETPRFQKKEPERL